MELEYKVIQATTPYFAKSQNIATVMSEEEKAGWRLLEKCDNYKLRLQRDISHRAKDKDLGIDPYRTQVGINNAIVYGVTTVITLTVVYLIFLMVGAI
jgi:hypothetical protein